MLLQVTAGSGHHHPESMPSSMQNVASVQEVTQALVGHDTAEEQERPRLVSRDVVVDSRATKYPVRNDVGSPCKAPIEFMKLGLHARSMNYHAARLRSEEHTSELQSQSNLVC